MMNLLILTPDGEFLDIDIISLIVPAENGLLGILKDHAPLLSALKSGNLEYKNIDGIKKEVEIGSGLIEVNKNKIIILANTAKNII